MQYLFKHFDFCTKISFEFLFSFQLLTITELLNDEEISLIKPYSQWIKHILITNQFLTCQFSLKVKHFKSPDNFEQ